MINTAPQDMSGLHPGTGCGNAPAFAKADKPFRRLMVTAGRRSTWQLYSKEGFGRGMVFISRNPTKRCNCKLFLNPIRNW